ncbi:MAG: sigma-70 family RNA polymerase sigma factor [Bacteroidia bacterium]|nr:sigma-70 family RNA polymerase sigma factor [Bacteroidia bacterium]
MNDLNETEQILSKMALHFEEGFELLFITYYKPLKRIAHKMIGADFAEDVVQDVFMTIWNNRSLFTNVLSLKSYLYTTIQNKCLNVIRKENLLERYQVHCQMELIEEYVIEEELLMQLYQALELLPEHYKETMLKSLNGDSIAQIAYSMNTTEDTVKAYKRRAKHLLRKSLCHQTYLLLFIQSSLFLPILTVL